MVRTESKTANILDVIAATSPFVLVSCCASVGMATVSGHM